MLSHLKTCLWNQPEKITGSLENFSQMADPTPFWEPPVKKRRNLGLFCICNFHKITFCHYSDIYFCNKDRLSFGLKTFIEREQAHQSSSYYTSFSLLSIAPTDLAQRGCPPIQESGKNPHQRFWQKLPTSL